MAGTYHPYPTGTRITKGEHARPGRGSQSAGFRVVVRGHLAAVVLQTSRMPDDLPLRYKCERRWIRKRTSFSTWTAAGHVESSTNVSSRSGKIVSQLKRPSTRVKCQVDVPQRRVRQGQAVDRRAADDEQILGIAALVDRVVQRSGHDYTLGDDQ